MNDLPFSNHRHVSFFANTWGDFRGFFSSIDNIKAIYGGTGNTISLCYKCLKSVKLTHPYGMEPYEVIAVCHAWIKNMINMGTSGVKTSDQKLYPIIKVSHFLI